MSNVIRLSPAPGREISELDALIIDAMTSVNRLVKLRAEGANLSSREVELWQVLNSYQWLVSSMRADAFVPQERSGFSNKGENNA